MSENPNFGSMRSQKCQQRREGWVRPEQTSNQTPFQWSFWVGKERLGIVKRGSSMLFKGVSYTCQHKRHVFCCPKKRQCIHGRRRCMFYKEYACPNRRMKDASNKGCTFRIYELISKDWCKSKQERDGRVFLRGTHHGVCGLEGMEGRRPFISNKGTRKRSRKFVRRAEGSLPTGERRLKKEKVNHSCCGNQGFEGHSMIKVARPAYKGSPYLQSPPRCLEKSHGFFPRPRPKKKVFEMPIQFSGSYVKDSPISSGRETEDDLDDDLFDGEEIDYKFKRSTSPDFENLPAPDLDEVVIPSDDEMFLLEDDNDLGQHDDDVSVKTKTQHGTFIFDEDDDGGLDDDEQLDDKPNRRRKIVFDNFDLDVHDLASVDLEEFELDDDDDDDIGLTLTNFENITTPQDDYDMSLDDDPFEKIGYGYNFFCEDDLEPGLHSFKIPTNKTVRPPPTISARTNSQWRRIGRR